MATQIQFRRGTKTEHSSFTGATAEVTVNTSNTSLHVHDGVTAGGRELARADLSNHSGVGILTATTFSGNVIGNLTGDVTGNADTATALETARNFSISGDATTSTVSFDGTDNVGLALTLATVNSNVGSYGSSTSIPVVTVNGKGLITAVSTASVGTALTVSGDSGSENIDLLTESLTIAGGTNLTSSASANSVTINLDNNISLANINASGVTTSSGGFSGNLTGNVTGNLTGTATTATNAVQLQTARNFSISGDASSATYAFNGTGNVGLAVTLATVNSNVGSFGDGGAIPTITVNAKGLVTGVTTTAVNPANNGTLTLNTSGTGLSGSTTFSANQVSNTTFTVTSNATSSNTGSTIVARDGSGNFSAGTITATLSGNATSATSATSATTATNVTCTANNSTDETTYIVFVDDATGSQGAETDTALTYNPSTNALTAGDFNSTSDINLKKDIEIIQNATEILTEINGVKFSWKENDVKSVGVIAQDVEKVLPELVNTTDKGTKTVNYDGLIGVLIEAIKDQQRQIDELKSKLD